MRRIIREEDPPNPSTRISALREAATTVAVRRKTEPSRLTRLLRGELDWIVMKAMEKNRVQRYETAVGLARDIERYLNHEPIAACPPSALYRLQKRVRRNKAACFSTLAVFLGLASGLVLATWGLAEARRHYNVAEAERDAAREAKETAENAPGRRVARHCRSGGSARCLGGPPG